MIPGKLVDFEHGPVVMFLGTRSAEFRPAFSWVFGALAKGEEGTITILVPDVEGEQSFRNLEDNGRVALTVAEAISHESHQFKGRSIELRPSTAEERAIQDIHKVYYVDESHVALSHQFFNKTYNCSTTWT